MRTYTFRGKAAHIRPPTENGNDCGGTHRLAKAGKDGIILTEDMGLQQRMMIGPKLREAFCAPGCKQIFGAVHSRGLGRIFHNRPCVYAKPGSLLRRWREVRWIKRVPAMGFYAWKSAQKAKRYPDFRGNSQISKSTKYESLNLMIYFIEGFLEYSVKYTYIAVVKMDNRVVG